MQFPKFRVLLNAATPHFLAVEWFPYIDSEVQDVLGRDFDGSQDFNLFKDSVFIRTLNENMSKRDIHFTRIKDIIRGLYRCRLLFKLDLQKGFRHILRHEDS